MGDNVILIETAIESAGFVKGTKELEQAARAAASKISGLGDAAKLAVAKSLAAFEQQNQKYAQQKQRVEELRQKLLELSQTKVETDAFKRINSEMESVGKQLAKVEAKEREFLQSGGSESSPKFQAMQDEAARLADQYDRLLVKKQEMESNGTAYAPADTSGVTAQLDAEEAKLQATGRKLELSYAELTNRINENTAAKRSNASATTSGTHATKGLSDSVSGIGKGFKKGLMTILKYGLGIRSVYVLFRKLRQAISEGLKNLVQVDSATNKSMSALKSSATALKNAAASAFSGILNAAAPAITAVINMLTSAFNKLAELFAALSGKSTYQKAVVAQEDYAASLNNTSEAAKDLQNNLSGLDEINVYQAPNDSSSGGARGPSASDMFSEEAVGSGVAGFADKIISAFEKVKTWFNTEIVPLFTEAFKDIKFDNLIKSFSSLKKPALLLKDLFVDVAALVADIGGYFATWAINDALPEAIELIASALNLVLTAARPVIQGVKVFFDEIKPVLDWALGVVTEVMATARAGLDSLTSVFAQKAPQIKQLFADIGAAVTALWEIMKPVFDWIKNAVITRLQSAFEYVSNMLGDLIDVLSGVIEIVKGLLSGDLSAVLDGAKKLINGVVNSIKHTVVNGIETLKNGVINVVTGLKVKWESIWNGIKNTAVNLVSGIKKEVSSGFSGLKSTVSDIWNSLKNAIKTPVNAIISMINSFTSGIASVLNKMIDAINSISLEVPDWVPGIGSKTIGFNLKHISAGSIPLLAQGAVIPPNAPFAAILGDQRSGNNLEAPEALLRKIVREEAGGNAANNYAISAKVNEKTLFDIIINEATKRKITTGRNPFAFV